MTKKEEIEFHIQSDDYFGNLATTLDLISQDLQRQGHQKHIQVLKKLRQDLLYLQDHFQIINKKESTKNKVAINERIL